MNEETQQVYVVNWFERHYPEQSKYLHHSPNGGHRAKSTGAKMKLMGVRRGFPDLVLYWPVGDYQGLVIEMKVPGGRTTKEQQEWIQHFDEIQYQTTVVYSIEDARKALDGYMEGEQDG